MAYSIRYGKTDRRKKRRDRSSWFALAFLLLAIFVRLLSNAALEQAHRFLLGDTQAVEVFYEEFVKH